MTQSFDEWYRTMNENNWSIEGVASEAFETGAQSKQAEIDDLRKRIDDAVRSVAELIENTYNIDTMYGLENILNVLSGEENERS